MGVAEMIQFLEEEFGIVVADNEVTEKNLGTINAIADYVAARAVPDRLIA
jgi:acyl carrier protein